MGVLLGEMVKTASAQVDLWLLVRERRQLTARFPPRARSWLSWPALLFALAAGGSATFAAASYANSLKPRYPGKSLPAGSPAPSLVALAVVSEPLGGHAIASWPGGSRAGTTPFLAEVPRGARVHVLYDRENAEPYFVDVIANTAQTAIGHLHLPPLPLDAPPEGR